MPRLIPELRRHAGKNSYIIVYCILFINNVYYSLSFLLTINYRGVADVRLKLEQKQEKISNIHDKKANMLEETNMAKTEELELVARLKEVKIEYTDKEEEKDRALKEQRLVTLEHDGVKKRIETEVSF